MSSTIPILNVYYLLCYTWNRWEEGRAVDVSAVETNELVDLLAHALIAGTRRVVRRGLDRGYVEHAEDRSALRGKIDFAVTTKRALLRSARAHCRFDDLSHDVLHNRILRTTIGNLRRAEGLDPRLRDELEVLHRQLDPIVELRLTASIFGRVQLHRNNAWYDLLMRICELVHASLLVHEGDGTYTFRHFLRDEAMMARIFEEFVRNFYAREQRRFHVADAWIDWDGVSLDEDSRLALPRMHTDVTLVAKDRVIIMDTKYYVEMLKARFDVEKARSGHLYQLFAYLRNGERRGGPWVASEGILLYPSVGREIDLRYEIQGHRIRLCTVNLNQAWQGIHERLLDLVEPVSGH
jgi:5-methylcytosine-specific restriction enzyme subunit McrC